MYSSGTCFQSSAPYSLIGFSEGTSELAGPPWHPVLFTDERRLTLSTSDSLERVWRCRSEQYAACNAIKHEQFGGGSVMVWGHIYLEGYTDLHVTASGTLAAVRYQDKILRAIVRPHTAVVGPGFLRVKDNARPHEARVCRLLVAFLDGCPLVSLT